MISFLSAAELLKGSHVPEPVVVVFVRRCYRFMNSVQKVSLCWKEKILAAWRGRMIFYGMSITSSAYVAFEYFSTG